MKKLLFIACLIFAKAFAQDSITVQQYIDSYKSLAMAEMFRTGVPAAITLAQGIHESSAGKSDLVLSSNNHFGIKCKSSWTGKSVRHDDDASQECFRAYDSPLDSYKDHSDYLRANQRYAFLFQYDPLDYSAWAKGLKQAGYATNPKYAPILIKTIERYHLNDFTLLALNKLNDTSNLAANTPSGSFASPNPEVAELVRQVSNNTSLDISNTYPTGVFDINSCKVLYVEKGTSLLAVAIQNHVSLPNLIGWNDMDATDICQNSQLVYLEKKQKKGNKEVHEVKAGETLWQISQQEGIRLSNLLQYNQLSNASQPPIGQKIYLQNYAVQTSKVIK